MLEHQSDGHEHRAGIGFVEPCMGRSAAVNRLEICAQLSEVPTRGETQATHDAGAEIRKDIAEHILSHYNGETLRALHHPKRYCVHVLDYALNAGVSLGDTFKYTSSESAAVTKYHGFVYEGDPVESMPGRIVKCVFEDALKPAARL